MVVDGRAELGPRALGHRSIIAPAHDPAMKDRLNEIKLRESYRPVAPICLEERAPEVFDPGTPDPYMLFEHHIRPGGGWRDRVPAVVHADGSARLQTVGPAHPLLFELLTAYERHSGIPVLCNTSANHPGRGFFPDAASAMRWGGVPRVWSRAGCTRRTADHGGPSRRHLGDARDAPPFAVRVAATLRLSDHIADGHTGLKALARPAEPTRTRSAGSCATWSSSASTPSPSRVRTRSPRPAGCSPPPTRRACGPGWTWTGRAGGWTWRWPGCCTRCAPANPATTGSTAAPSGTIWPPTRPAVTPSTR
ncbi:carbamoyltransferase C-terminal domain-containing protein [Micromonospora sp. BRA006-A]|nr:carbamoyltransferase C-terminal domain-containing protein [Micromonospora sp. BRA006-A]